MQNSILYKFSYSLKETRERFELIRRTWIRQILRTMKFIYVEKKS